MNAVGVVFQLNSTSLCDKTPKEFPHEKAKDLIGYNNALRRFKELSFFGILVGIPKDNSSPWLADNHGVHNLEVDNIQIFSEGCLVVRE